VHRIDLGRRAASRANNFDLLRLVAASMVLVSHSFTLSGHADPFIPILGNSLGALGLETFFAISGFLVAKSWFTDPRLKAFVLKRAVRIMPGLIVAAAITAFVIGLLFTDLGPGRYLTDSGTYEFVAKNWSLFAINLYLPGVFESNVYPAAVNGSMWTLPLEACAYALIAALGVLGLLRRPQVSLTALAVLLVITSPYAGLDLNVSSVPGGVDGGKFELGLQIIAIFLTSTSLYLYRDRIPLHPLLFIAAVGAYFVSRDSDVFKTVTILTIPYVVLFLAYWRPSPLAKALTRPGDLSYGIYIYAFPIQQSIAHLRGGAFPAVAMIALAFPITYLVAFASWRLVERPALRLKQGRARSARPAPAAAETAVSGRRPARVDEHIAVVQPGPVDAVDERAN
jgi:peptidoglycan/LPS O-acetylase OafA/YrhL